MKNSDFFAKIYQGFIVCSGITYSTGFLIVFTFLDRFGIKETGAEFFKVKYIQVGMMCMLFPAVFCTIILALFYIRSNLKVAKKRSQDETLKESRRIFKKVPIPSFILISNLLLVFYIFVMFAPPGFIRTRMHFVFLVFVSTVIGSIFIRRITLEFWQSCLRWLLCSIILGFDGYAFKGLYNILWEMLLNGGYIFIFFVALIGIIVWRVWRAEKIFNYPIYDNNKKLQIALRCIGVCMITAIYYLSVMSFAYTVYPYIPAAKGGGDYTYTPNTILRFVRTFRHSIPPEVLKSGLGNCLESIPLKIIEETTVSIVIADPTDAGGPEEWRKGIKKPTIRVIRRECVANITCLN